VRLLVILRYQCTDFEVNISIQYPVMAQNRFRLYMAVVSRGVECKAAHTTAAPTFSGFFSWPNLLRENKKWTVNFVSIYGLIWYIYRRKRLCKLCQPQTESFVTYKVTSQGDLAISVVKPQ